MNAKEESKTVLAKQQSTKSAKQWLHEHPYALLLYSATWVTLTQGTLKSINVLNYGKNCVHLTWKSP